MMENKLKELILKGEFMKVKSIIHNVTKDELEAVLFEIGCDEESICAYSFMCFLMLEDESVEYHCLTSGLLNIAFPYLPGAYETSLYHIRRAIQLDPEDMELKRTLLFFNEIPEKLVGDKEASIILNEIK
ncbi:hypothetical protein [Clostridium botulinum]|uniref:hypothetical protein n=1 Tax=Clostridium botulinum TaxID=1491 RepID=UPI003DA309D6